MDKNYLDLIQALGVKKENTSYVLSWKYPAWYMKINFGGIREWMIVNFVQQWGSSQQV